MQKVISGYRLPDLEMRTLRVNHERSDFAVNSENHKFRSKTSLSSDWTTSPGLAFVKDRYCSLHGDAKVTF